jgi:hypothetical protein
VTVGFTYYKLPKNESEIIPLVVKKKQINSKAQASVARLMLFDLGLEQIENIQNGETNRKEVHVGDYCCQMKCQFHQCC